VEKLKELKKLQSLLRRCERTLFNVLTFLTLLPCNFFHFGLICAPYAKLEGVGSPVFALFNRASV
jgi:hypothetical protein